jgi:putrescine aminotransferase
LLADVRRVPFGDADALRAAVDASVAAVIVEPVQAEGGVHLPPDGYLRSVRAICDAGGAVMIADEVQTGLGRCGELFACDREGVVPDVMVLAKGLSGGVMPIGAYIARPDVWNAAYAKAPLLHTSTFGGGELACAAALAALDVLVDEELAACAHTRGAQLLDGARATMTRYPQVIADVRGAGLLVGVELRSEGYGGTIIPELLRRGVTAAWTLNAQRVIRLEPPLIVRADQIDVALRAFDDAIAATLDALGVLA